MRVEVREGKIVCVAKDWNALEANERKFLSSCYWTAIWTGFDKSGALTFNVSGDARTKTRRIADMQYYAANNDVEVADELESIKEGLKEKAREVEEQEESARRAELKRDQWKNRHERGCVGCPYSLQVGDGWFRCEYSGDELDGRFMEQWNPIIKAMELFHEVGVPNEHCKDYVKEEIKAFGGAR